MTPEDRIAERLLRWEEAWEHGRDIPPGELCTDDPGLEPELRERIADLKATAWVKEPPGDGEHGPLDAFQWPMILGGRYRVEGLVAEGGHGRVYRAYDPELQRPVAVKIPRPRRCIGPEQADSLLEEARRSANLRHPGIVAVHDVGRYDGTCFIVSDLIDGENLADRIARSRPTPTEAARLVAEVAMALHFAHERGFVHRDIKPANILIDRQGRPHVTDFGIAVTADDLVVGRAASAGTLPYMAPEQVAGEIQLIDARTDLYALGVVLYELLTGRLPYQARTPTALREQILFRPPLPLRPDDSVPPGLEQIALRCLTKHPADRFDSAQELAVGLQAALSVGPVRNRLGLIPILLLTTLVLGAGAILNWCSPKRRSSEPDAARSTLITPPIAQDGVLVFDGTTRIVTSMEQFAPVTLEAWVRPGSYNMQGCQFVIGSDIPTRYGIGLAICGVVLSAEYVEGVIRSDRAVSLNRWSHLAAVFAPDETRLYLDGEQIANGPATKVLAGTPFVIGNVGLGNPIDYFRGQLRAVRISSGERYTEGFQPEQSFTSDPADSPCRAVLIYDGSHVEGDRVIDLSGNGKHGRIEKTGG